MHKIFCVLFLVLMACSRGSSEEELLADFEDANQLLKSKEYQQAIERYNSVINEQPKFAEALNNRGIAYMEQGYFQKALVDYEQALQIQPEFFNAAFNRTNALWALGRWQPALDDLKILATSYDSAAIFFRMGQIYYEQNQLQEALQAFDGALQRDSSYLEAWINRGNVQFYLGRMAESYIDIQKALSLEPENPIALNSNALLAIEHQQYQEALKWIDLALNVKPQDPYFLNNKGQIYLELDSLELAESFINRSMLLDPENPWVFRNKAIWYLKTGSPLKALDLLEQLQAMSPNLTVKDFFFYQGAAHNALDNTQEACASWFQGKQNDEKASILKWQEHCQ